MLPDNTDPAKLESEAIQTEINRLYTSGELRLQSTLGTPAHQDGRPPAPIPGVNQNWDLDMFRGFLQKERAVSPQFLGSNPVGYQNVLAQAKDVIGGAEGFSDKPYHGIYSKLRRKGDANVRPGEFKEGGENDEVSIAYGWNLSAHPESRSLFKSMFGMSDEDVTSVFNGQRGLTREQGDQLRDHAIMSFNKDVDRLLPGVQLRDHQRAALISLAYNMGGGGLRKSGIPDLIKSGASDQEVAAKIAGSFNSKQAALANRRKHEAALYMGSKAADFFASVDTNQLK
ncbi:hypothetical protein [Rhizobacter sp. Root1221]|uniref:glycoside hydrolase family protein n=1 Tax=Rhizobacter sp. Root1221 TaxID=1736433 RepID=UPI0006FCE391|nr:hypothetical protein [Rhizobacter sp. Root1221]KQV99966.1 hypothetical protein ASC87_19895 [Rhizobacter sp. Root1221]